MDDLGFIIGGKINDIVKILQEVSNVVIRWGIRNAVSFDIEKIEAIPLPGAQAAWSVHTD